MPLCAVFLSSAILLTISIFYTSVLGQGEQKIEESTNQISLSNQSHSGKEDNKIDGNATEGFIVGNATELDCEFCNATMLHTEQSFYDRN